MKTRLGLSATPRGLYGSFAGKTQEAAPTGNSGFMTLLGVG